MIRITPNFNFDGNCYEAILLYQEAFGARIHQLIRNQDAVWEPDCHTMPETRKDQIYHAEIFIGDQRMMMCDNPDVPFQPTASLSLTVTLEKKTQVMRAYEVLAKGGTIIYPLQSTAYSSCYASLMDRFGFRWVMMTEQTDQ